MIPEQLGRRRASTTCRSPLALEEIAAGDGATSTIVSVQNSVVCGPIDAFGTDAQKERWLTPLARGEMLGCFCLTEPQVGSDAGAIATRAGAAAATRTCSNGVKQFITTGKNADVAIVFAVTDKAAGKKGISAFIVDTKTRRLRRRARRGEARPARVRHRADRVRELRSPGGEPARHAKARATGSRCRISRPAASASPRRRSAWRARRSRRRSPTRGSGRASASRSPTHQAVNFKLADMATEIEVARQMVWHAAALRDAGLPCLKEASMAKLFASEMAERVCSAAIQVHGGYGYVNDFPVERIYRDVRVCQIYEGTSEIQRLVIGRAIAG